MDKPHSGRHCASGVPPGAHCPSLWGQARQGRLPEEKGRAFARPSLCAERKVNTMREWCLLLEHLCHFVGYELDFGADDDLYRGLGRAHDARNTRRLDLLFVHLGVIL